MPAKAGAEAAAHSDAVGDDGAGNLVHLRPAVFFRHVHRGDADLAGLAQQLAHHRPILVLHLFNVGDDFFLCEFFRRLRDQLVLLAEILRREYVFHAALFQQPASALDFAFR